LNVPSFASTHTKVQVVTYLQTSCNKVNVKPDIRDVLTLLDPAPRCCDNYYSLEQVIITLLWGWWQHGELRKWIGNSWHQKMWHIWNLWCHKHNEYSNYFYPHYLLCATAKYSRQMLFVFVLFLLMQSRNWHHQNYYCIIEICDVNFDMYVPQKWPTIFGFSIVEWHMVVFLCVFFTKMLSCIIAKCGIVLVLVMP
jgi:hypothetical protein